MQPGTDINDNLKSCFLIPRIYDPNDWRDVIHDKKTYSYEDYKRLPEGAPYQLIGGSLIMTPAPDVYHQEISGRIEFQLREYVMKNDIGKVYDAPIDVRLSETDVYQPDIIFILHKNKSIIGRKEIEGPPDMIIEILSPATAYYDLREKYKVYEKCGVSEYWIADPKQKKIEVYENKNNKYCLIDEAEESGSVSSKIIEGFSVSLSHVFSQILKQWPSGSGFSNRYYGHNPA